MKGQGAHLPLARQVREYLSSKTRKNPALQDRLYPLHDALFSDSSPGPVKYALTRVCPDMPGDVRLPITWPSEASRLAVDRALEIAGLV